MLNLSETQWMIVALMVLVAVGAGIGGYLWGEDEKKKKKKNGSRDEEIVMEVPLPAPTKNQEWSYGHAFVPEQLPPPHDPGHSVESGAPLNASYCRWGTTPIGIVDGENDLNYFQIYTVQPSFYNLKYYKNHL